MALVDGKCIKISSGTPILSDDQKKQLAAEIPQWTIQEQAIYRDWLCKDFLQAMVFVNRIAELAEQENHHPDIRISYNKVHIELSTHKIGGLSINDFILAAKIDVI
jgi:4a-hydroxytetrahydrobiopterin dehydratase